jgi:putative transposase
MRYHAHDHTSGEGPLYQWRFKSVPRQDDEHFLTVCGTSSGMPCEQNGYRLPNSGAGDHFGKELKMQSRNPALLTSWPISQPRDGTVRVNQPLTKRELHQFNELLPIFIPKLKHCPHRI